jgi:hypothetical protein
MMSLDHPEDKMGATRTRGENFVPINLNITKNLKTYVPDIKDF